MIVRIKLETLTVNEWPGHLSVDLQLPIYARSYANLRQHWSKTSPQAREQRGATNLGLSIARPSLRRAIEDGMRLTVTLTRIRPARRRALDTDNLSRSLKAIRDGVADAVGIDDGDARILFNCEQDTADDYAVRIQIQGGAK